MPIRAAPSGGSEVNLTPITWSLDLPPILDQAQLPSQAEESGVRAGKRRAASEVDELDEPTGAALSPTTQTPAKRARPNPTNVVTRRGVITAQSIARCTANELFAHGMRRDNPRMCWAGYESWVETNVPKKLSKFAISFHVASLDAFNTYLVGKGSSLTEWLSNGQAPQSDDTVQGFQAIHIEKWWTRSINTALNFLLQKTSMELERAPAADDASARAFGTGTAKQIRDDLKIWLPRVTELKSDAIGYLSKAIGSLETFIQQAGEGADSVDKILSGTASEMMKNATVERCTNSNTNTRFLSYALRWAKLMREAGKDWV